MHTTRIIICHPDSMGHLSWISDHDPNAIRERINDARRRGVHTMHINRVGARIINRYANGALSRILQRREPEKPIIVVHGFRQCEKPNAETMLSLKEAGETIVDQKYRSWVRTFVQAVHQAPASYRIYTR